MGPCRVSLLQSPVRSSHGTTPVPAVQYLQECTLWVTHSMRGKCHCGIESGCGYYNDGVGVHG